MVLADRDERGASATEYGLLVVAIAAVVAIVAFALGEQVVGLFQTSCDEITGQASTAASCN